VFVCCEVSGAQRSLQVVALVPLYVGVLVAAGVAHRALEFRRTLVEGHAAGCVFVLVAGLW